jgi:predicted TIM-barrel fold metal-dependent hydrolase
MSAPGFKVIRRMLAERDDCWTKISSFYRLSDVGPPRYEDMRPFVKLLLSQRLDRCVWPDDSVREPLFAANAERLYSLGKTLLDY